MNKIVNVLYKLSIKAMKNNEVPVSAVIILNNKIISKTYNKRTKTHNVLAHAEVRCITKAARKLKDWRLDNCIMYVSLYPCSLCQEVIKESRIKEVYYILKNPETKNQKTSFKQLKISKNIYLKFENNICSFFKKMR